MIFFDYMTDQTALPEGLTEEKITGFLEDCVLKLGFKKTGQLSITFTTDRQIRQINREIFGREYATDTITLSFTDSYIISADIYISTETVRRNAKEYGPDYQTELLRVLIHSLLHAAGYSDNTDEKRAQMRCLEDACLKYFD
jgi:rRNA maturation RNase YbeY